MASNELSVDVNESVSELHRSQVVSDKSALTLGDKKRRRVAVPNLDAVTCDPIHVCLLLDASGSMKICRDAFIRLHPVLLSAFRESAQCRKDGLFVLQYLFNTQARPLTPYTRLGRTQGSDDVVLLSESNYRPEGKTALYMTVRLVLQDIVSQLVYCKSQDFAPGFILGVVTDGQDTENGVPPDDIRRVLDDLRSSDPPCLHSAVLVGLESPEFPRETFEETGRLLGFDSTLLCSNTDERQIRATFHLFSQSSVGAIGVRRAAAPRVGHK
jgi:hypothetical protein